LGGSNRLNCHEFAASNDPVVVRACRRGRARLQRGVSTPVAQLVSSLIATLSRTAAGSRMKYETIIAEDVSAPFDRTDLVEVLGNLLENATRHARTLVRIVARPSPAGMSISIEDDGPGIAEDLRPAALARGGRFDEQGEGTGLGLAIVQDVLDAYGWTLHLGASELGGLKASCRECASVAGDA
jgi:signal transduction histidine kinase